MKINFICFVTLLLFVNFRTFSQFVEPTNFKGAFAPYPAQQWTEGWVNWDPQNTNYNQNNKQLVDVTTNITSATTWTADKIYVLKSLIYVKNGATLTIEPGTVIYGDVAYSGSGLFVTLGAKLMAEGTVDKPIVFTSNQNPGERIAGDWGGVILMGKAKNNLPGGLGNIEGIAVSPDTEFGGNDDADNSGSLKYVRIEYAGYPYQPNKEINGLTFASVGSGTTIDYIQVSFSNDDSFEWIGGSVNCKHLIAYRGLDDDFDTDKGYSGTVQFGLGVRDPKIADNPTVSTSEGFESDNDPSGDNATPQTSALFANMTMVGPLRGNKNATVADGYRRAARIRRNSALKIENSIMIDFVRGLHVDGIATETNATNGSLHFKNNILAGYSDGKVGEVNTGSIFDIKTFIGSQNDTINSSSNILMYPYGLLSDYQNPDFRQVYKKCLDINISSDGNTTFCQGGFVNLKTTAGSNYIYEWYNNGQLINGATTSTYQATSSGYYTVKVIDGACNATSTATTVIVNQYPSSGVNISGNTTFCEGNSVTLIAQGSGTYLWSNGATSKSITVSQAGSYGVAITSNGCVSNSNQTTVTVNPNPTATITPQGNTTFCQGGFVNLVASGGTSYQWNIGSSAASISVTQSGNYTVNVFNSFGCQATESQQVIVNPLPNVTLNALNQFTLKNASPIQLVASPAGGTFNGDGLQGSTFNPSLTTLGLKTITYNYTSTQGCSGNAVRSTIVVDSIGNVCNVTKYDTVKVTKTINDTVSILKVKFKLTTGIKANQYTTMNVYPNPTSDLIIIEASDATSLNGYSYKLVDAQGKEVCNVLVTNVKTEISLKTFGKSGVYILHVLDANNASIQTKQIILE